MEGFVQIISKEMIKPSSQSPLHPKILNLTYMDKVLSHIYIPLIFFYEGDESRGLTTSNHLPILQRLKQTLFDTLPSFYPLSGRLKNELLVDCNDAGVEFVDARVRAHLKDAMSMDHHQLKQYLPWYCTAFDHGKRPRPLLAVQITLFDCGGLVVGVGVSHTVGDLASAMAFVDAWAAASRGGGGEETAPPLMSFGTSDYFPSLWFVPLSRVQRFFLCDETFMTKRFVFDEEKLDILRRSATAESSESTINDPSRVELVSAFIWQHFMAARLKKSKARKMFAAIHTVNVRQRTPPPRLLENVFGNCFVLATAYAGGEELRLHELIGRLRRSIRRVRDDYIMKPLNKESFMMDLLKLVALVLMGKVEWCWFTSWRGFPTSYELDYGCGKPVWFTTPSMPAKNLIVLVSSKSGEEVEAIVTMMPDDLQILESQINLISTN